MNKKPVPMKPFKGWVLVDLRGRPVSRMYGNLTYLRDAWGRAGLDERVARVLVTEARARRRRP